MAERDREINRLKAELASAQQSAESSSPAQLSSPKPVKATRPKAETTAASPKKQAFAKKDDLTRIKGIGKVLVEKLNDIGIHSFEQIASFTQADIDRVKQEINTRGRGEPKNWIDQARSLMKDEQSRS